MRPDLSVKLYIIYPRKNTGRSTVIDVLKWLKNYWLMFNINEKIQE